MTRQTLMLIEATDIQGYIFGSNQLAQNIGASELVQQATTDWVYSALPPPHNIDGAEITDRRIRADGLAVEVVYTGGGNAMMLFDSEGQALEFARRFSRTVLEKAPGLQIILKRKTFDPNQQSLAVIHQDLRGELAQRKLDRPPSTPLAGLGVTAACVFTGAPAVGTDDEGRLISAEVKAKLNAEEQGKARLKEQLSQVTGGRFEFVYNFSDFGTPGESSYLAVIHTDGNAMGKRIKKIGEQHAVPEKNQDYILALRCFSGTVQTAAEAALKKTVALLLDPNNLRPDPKDPNRYTIGGIVPVPERDGKRYLPFRPIVFGGDDVTFVCEGRLGLAVAASYLTDFSRRPLSDGNLAHARAGVAVVKSHYPFSRAYELAEDLCKSAKRYIKEAADNGLTAFDWHFAVGGLVLPLKDVREREYTATMGSLLMRPLRLNPPDGDWRSWKTFMSVMAEFQKEEKDGGQWAGRRNKIKALRDALRDGPGAVKQFLHIYNLKLLDVPGRPDMKEQGWQGDECGYFDVIEALDFYVPLKGG